MVVPVGNMSDFDRIYVWGNNAKRARFKGRACRVVARAKMNSVLLEFEDGERLVTSRHAIRLRAPRKRGELRHLNLYGGSVKRHYAGYLLEFVRGRGWVPQHRLVVEHELGRKLERREQVHHLNGICDDNRIENLELHSSARSHSSRHRKHDHEAILALYLAGLGSEVVAARVGCAPATVVHAARQAGVIRSRSSAAASRPRDAKGHFVPRVGA